MKSARCKQNWAEIRTVRGSFEAEYKRREPKPLDRPCSPFAAMLLRMGELNEARRRFYCSVAQKGLEDGGGSKNPRARQAPSKIIHAGLATSTNFRAA